MATLQLLSRQIAVLSAALDSTKKRGSQIAVEREKLKQQMTALELRLKAVKQLVDEVSENSPTLLETIKSPKLVHTILSLRTLKNAGFDATLSSKNT